MVGITPELFVIDIISKENDLSPQIPTNEQMSTALISVK